MLKSSSLPRLLKKVQMQGGARGEARAYCSRTSQRRASAPPPHPLPPRQRGERCRAFFSSLLGANYCLARQSWAAAWIVMVAFAPPPNVSSRHFT